MTFFRHTIGGLFLGTVSFLFSLTSNADPQMPGFYAQSRACQLASQGPSQWFPANSCQGKSDNAFDPCVVHDWANAIQIKIQSRLTEECQTEVQVKTAEAQFEQAVQKYNADVKTFNQARAAAANGYSSGVSVPQPTPPKNPEAEMSPEVKLTMHRLYPGKYHEPGSPEALSPDAPPYRSDNCLSDHIDQLRVNIQQRCDPNIKGNPINENARLKCDAATNVANKASEYLGTYGKGLEVTDQTRDVLGMPTKYETDPNKRGPVENAQIIQANLGLVFNELVEANKACANAIVELASQCLPSVSEFMGDESRQELFANNCTPNGFTAGIDNVVSLIGSRQGPPKKMNDLSKQHIANRDVMADLAAHVQNATNEVIARMDDQGDGKTSGVKIERNTASGGR